MSTELSGSKQTLLSSNKPLLVIDDRPESILIGTGEPSLELESTRLRVSDTSVEASVESVTFLVHMELTLVRALPPFGTSGLLLVSADSWERLDVLSVSLFGGFFRFMRGVVVGELIEWFCPPNVR